MQDLYLGLFQLLVGHGAVAGSKIDGAVEHLANTTAATDRLIVDLYVRMNLVVLTEPFRIHGIRERGARSVQGGLSHEGQRQREGRQQQRDAIFHSRSPPDFLI